jgi:acyl dehydratase
MSKKWHPQPFHIDLEEAKASIFGGLSACSSHNLSIMALLLFEKRGQIKVLAGLGTEKMKFINSSRPGDRLSIRYSLIEKRDSNSRPNAGIVKSLTLLINQNNEVILEAVTYVLATKNDGQRFN